MCVASSDGRPKMRRSVATALLDHHDVCLQHPSSSSPRAAGLQEPRLKLVAGIARLRIGLPPPFISVAFPIVWRWLVGGDAAAAPAWL